MLQGSSSSEWPVEEVLKIAFSTRPGKKEHADNTVRRRTPTISAATQSLPSVSSHKHKVGEKREVGSRTEGSRGSAAIPPFVTPLHQCTGSVFGPM